MIKFRITKDGKHLHTGSYCHKKNIEVGVCRKCDNLLSIETFGGLPKRLLCRGAGINGFNRKSGR